MKLFTKFAFATLLVAGVVSMSSCSDDDDNGGDAGKTVITAKKGNYTGYVQTVAGELETEALKVLSYWVGQTGMATMESELEVSENPYTDLIEVKGYQDFLKMHTRIYNTNEDVISAMIQGAVTIAKEVHEAKIGDPFTNTNIFGVESWYSFNTFTDYHNNIVSIQKVIMGTEDMASIETAQKGAKNSLYELMYIEDASATGYAEKLRMAILKARQAFNKVTTAAPEKPFRDYVAESFPAVHATIAPIQTAIAELETVLGDVDTKFTASETEDEDAVIASYVDNTVIATYKKLYMKAALLNTAVAKYADAPTQANLDAACAAWKETRIPWEHSEAWLIGPVDTYGVDPNIDSWPLSQININYLLTAEIDWSDGSGSLSQATKGFHTLEYLLFKDGKARVISELFVGDNVMIEAAN